MSICYSLEEMNDFLKNIEEPDQLDPKKLTQREQLIIERVISDGIENVHRNDIFVHHDSATKENFLTITREIPIELFNRYSDKAIKAVWVFHNKRLEGDPCPVIYEFKPDDIENNPQDDTTDSDSNNN